MNSTSSAGFYFQLNYGFLIFPVLTLITIVLYRRRLLQALITNVLIFLFAFQDVIFAPGFNLKDGFGFDEIIIFTSFLNILLLWFARRSIIKDEALVRSIDRIR